MEKPQKLKRLTIEKVAVFKGKINFYVMLVDLNKGVSIGIQKNIKFIKTESFCNIGYNQD